MSKTEIYARRLLEWAAIKLILPAALFIERRAPWALTFILLVVAGVISREGVIV
jgi:hypothetical protein